MSGPNDSIRDEARRLEIIAAVISGIIGLGLLFRFMVLPILSALREPALDLRQLSQLLGENLILALPPILFLGALAAARKVCVRLREGELFDRAVARGVRDIGSSLLWGAAALAVITPNLLTWVRGDPGGLELDLELETLIIGFVGAAMMLLGRVLGRAERLQTEQAHWV